MVMHDNWGCPPQALKARVSLLLAISQTERPFFAAAIMCPVADMYYGELRCSAMLTKHCGVSTAAAMWLCASR